MDQDDDRGTNGDRDIGFRRLVTFGDGVAAIAITLLVFPLVDSANDIGSASLHQFYDHNRQSFIAFGLSFLVIWAFWWGQHQVLREAKSYNPLLVLSMFAWLLAIVFLPFPTELLGSVHDGIETVHVLYIATMLVAAVAIFLEVWAISHWPELQLDPERPRRPLDVTAILVVLMSVALVVTIAVPSFGLWSLVLLLAERPLARLVRWRRANRTPVSPAGQAPN